MAAPEGQTVYNAGWSRGPRRDVRCGPRMVVAPGQAQALGVV